MAGYCLAKRQRQAMGHGIVGRDAMRQHMGARQQNVAGYVVNHSRLSAALRRAVDTGRGRGYRRETWFVDRFSAPDAEAEAAIRHPPQGRVDGEHLRATHGITLILHWIERRWSGEPDGRARGIFARDGVLLPMSLGLASHFLLDYLISYGIRPWLPFSGRWYYGDFVFVVDPLTGRANRGVGFSDIPAQEERHEAANRTHACRHCGARTCRAGQRDHLGSARQRERVSVRGHYPVPTRGGLLQLHRDPPVIHRDADGWPLHRGGQHHQYRNVGNVRSGRGR